MRISDWSSDVCSSDLLSRRDGRTAICQPQRRCDDGVDRPLERLEGGARRCPRGDRRRRQDAAVAGRHRPRDERDRSLLLKELENARNEPGARLADDMVRSEEHTSELQSLMRISYAVFCLKKKNKQK